MQKKSLKQIQISDIDLELPDLKNTESSKASTISKWIIDWIEHDLQSGKISAGYLIPSKPELAFHLGVSTGTIQNALRLTEDLGYVESKQCIGTVVKEKNSASEIRKLTSKREKAINDLKKFIIENKFKTGVILPSSRNISKAISASFNTTRLALEKLCSEGILEHQPQNSQYSGWVVKNNKFLITDNNTEQETLVRKVETDLKNYITNSLKTGDRMPPHFKLAKQFNVSIKTIHDALQTLIQDGILLPRRGRYGTSVIRMPYDNTVNTGIETSIFAKAQDTAFYYYERTQNHIKRIISENYSIGDRLPSIMALSKEMDLSPNTIRKAFKNLASEGYLTFSRGRYGGTFVIDIPETETQAFKWLAVNPKYAETYKS